MITAKYANYYIGSDAYPYEIVRVVSDKTLEVRRMDFVATEDSNYFGNQKYNYISKPDAEVVRIRKRKNGKWMEQGAKCGGFGLADEPHAYRDPSF